METKEILIVEEQALLIGGVDNGPLVDILSVDNGPLVDILSIQLIPTSIN